MGNFKVRDPRGILVSCTEEQWNDHVLVEHPIMTGNEEAVKETIKDPDFIYRSSQTPIRDVYFKRNTSSSYSKKLYTKVVAEYSLRNEAEIVTAFPHKKVKGGIEDEPIYEK